MAVLTGANLVMPVTVRACRGEQEFPALVAIWRSAVEATHPFLSPADLAEIERALPTTYLPAVTLTIADVDGRPVGFAGTAGARLEMLFVENAFRGRGIGSALLDHAVLVEGITELDVNEQNPDAVAFYTRKGFQIIGRSALDGAGRPYPLLHMRK